MSSQATNQSWLVRMNSVFSQLLYHTQCSGYFFHGWHQIPGLNQLWKEGFICAQAFMRHRSHGVVSILFSVEMGIWVAAETH